MITETIAGLFCARRTRGPIAFGVMIALLWTQVAIAAYACPLPSALPADARSAVDMSAEHSDCHGAMTSSAAPTASSAVPPAAPGAAMASMPDPDNPALCLEHCRQGGQTTDSTASIPVAAPAPVHFLYNDSPTDGRASIVSALAVPLTRATSPPKAIAHCCFRI